MQTNNHTKIIRTRIAPSPTGFLHIGTARTAFFNYIFAKQNNGQIILRIEDTDKDRSKKEFEDSIVNGFEWLNIKFDETYRQSDRTEIHKKYLESLLAADKAFLSKEQDQDTGAAAGKRSEVIRFRNPREKISFEDKVRGTVEFDTAELGDFVIAKSLDEPLYNFAAVVDDFEMNISHIIRGEDHISNTPRQILLQEALGLPRPIYAHLPLILSSDRSKMSKRGGAKDICQYKETGYLPEALLNYLILLGWNPGTEQEIFSFEELLEKFDLTKIQKGGAVFDAQKLNWVNKEYIKLLDSENFKQKVLEFLPEANKKMAAADNGKFEKILPLIRERIEKFEDVGELSRAGDLNYYFVQPKYETEKLLWKGENDLTRVKTRFEKICKLLEKVSDFSADNLKRNIWPFAEEEGRGAVLWPMRYALSGKDKTPDPFSLAEILGKEETIKRLNYAIQKIISTNNT
ncbi:MAG: glutamate--tRNA ligase [Patescibacteria group bacterium]